VKQRIATIYTQRTVITIQY